MGLFGWLRGKQRTKGLYPENLWTVTIVDDVIIVDDNRQQRRRLAFDRLAAVAVETNDTGPWGADFWWLLKELDRDDPLPVPQGATGEQALIVEIMKLPGVDGDAFLRAMRSTDNAVFMIWSAPNGPAAD